VFLRRRRKVSHAVFTQTARTDAKNICARHNNNADHGRAILPLAFYWRCILQLCMSAVAKV
jgi:hypothetical protein